MKLMIIALFATAASAAMAPLHTVKERINSSYIIVFNDDVDALASISAIGDDSLFKSLGGRVDRIYEHALRGFAATLTLEALEFVRSFNFVKYVEEDQVLRTAGVQFDPPWNLDRLDQKYLPLDGRYSYPNTGHGATVYIIDTGIQATNVEFSGRATQAVNFAFNPFGESENEDCNGHGTHCAGIVGGTTYGVAKEVTLVGVKAFNCYGSGSISAVVSAINYVIEQSQSHPDEPAVALLPTYSGGSTTLDNSARSMVDVYGVTTVVAAGNDGYDACNFSPARVTEVITVGSTDENDARSSFSNYGDCVDIYAPGTSIKSAWIGSNTATNTVSGTSMAASHVAGAAAIILTYFNEFTPAEVSYIIKALATHDLITGAFFDDLFLHVPPPATV